MKRFEVLSALALLLFCGYVGYSTNYVASTAIASELPLPVIGECKPNVISLDLNQGTLFVESANNLNLNVKRKDSIIYKTSIVEKPVAYIVRELPPVKEVKSNVLSVITTDNLEKINLDRN